METIPKTLSAASASALGGLAAAARAVAAPSLGGAAERTMASAARTAIFADALLAAMHARLEELKSVAK